jgi:hypothetical protein
MRIARASVCEQEPPLSSITDLPTVEISGAGMRKIQRQPGTVTETTSTSISTATGTLESTPTRDRARHDGAGDLVDALRRVHDGTRLENSRGFLAEPDKRPGDANPDTSPAMSSKSQGYTPGKVVGGAPDLTHGKAVRDVGSDRHGCSRPGSSTRLVQRRPLCSILGRERYVPSRGMSADPGISGSLLDSECDGRLGSDVAEIGAEVLPECLIHGPAFAPHHNLTEGEQRWD